MRILIIILILLFSALVLLSSQKGFLAFRTYEWDSLRCAAFYGPDDIEELQGAPEKLATFAGGMDTLGFLIEYPDLPTEERKEGRVLFRFVITKNGFVEFMQYISVLPMPYIEATVRAIEKLEFRAAENRGRKLDWGFVVPVFFTKDSLNIFTPNKS